MKSEIHITQVSLKKPIEEFGHWLVQQMNHSGLPLYLVLHPEEIEILSDARPIGLEVNLPTGIDVYMGRDDLDRGRKKKRIDLVFKKENDYYLVEIIDKKRLTTTDKNKMKEYVRCFKENLGFAEKIRVVPIIVRPKDSPSQAFLLFDKHVRAS
ncbi:MAG: hypothetical protein ACETVN_05055 [Asgard group archaeon]